ncbi:YesL family protein [Paenibacillus sp. RC84]|uniref:YesL family protein n=1 Tax=Paenibacillus sp. RC84 TaxID=3156252 RepID=UPI0035166639
MEFRGLMGGFYRISEWIMRLSAINLLWILCSIPFFFFALAGLTSGQADIMMQSLVLMGILAPFTLFPSTAAMFTVARKWVTGDEDVPLFKTFFRGYKENFLQSMIGGIAFVLFALILFVSYRFYAGLDSALSLLSYMFLAMGILLIGAFFNFFCIMSHLHMKVFQIIKNAILLTIGNPVTSVMTIIGNVAIVIISFRFSFLLVFFAGSVSATFSFWQFNRSFEKIKRKQEAMEEAEREREQEENGQAAELDAASVREDDSTKKESEKL